jgi:ABC-type sugar transport system ATPase subunit
MNEYLATEGEAKVILELKGIKKHFGGVQALDGVDFKLYENEIIGLIGDNGAGKSTLVKIITGLYTPNEGEIFLEGNKIHSLNPKRARELGIETIFQDLALFDVMDISANLFAGREIKMGGFWLNQKKMDKLAQEALDKTGITLGSSLRQIVGELSGGQKHAVAISRSVYVSGSPKIILMDEPTAGLGVKESNVLLEIVKGLKKSGVSVILITHNLDHAFEVVDRFFVLRSGRAVGERPVDKCNSIDLIEMMVGVQEVNSKATTR